jgi:GntR family transcriptional regulator
MSRQPLVLSRAVRRNPGTPTYRRIADELRAQIKSGHYPPGVALPSVRKLRERFSVSHMTIRHAIQQLRTEGLVTIERGAGAFVREQPTMIRISGPERFSRADRARGRSAYAADMERLGKRWAIEALSVSREPAPAEVANRLGIDEGASVVRRHRVFSVEDVPHQIATSYIPLDLAQGTAIEQENTGPGGVYARLEESGHLIDSFNEEVSARMPSPEEREILSIPEGVPLLRVVRSAMDADGRVLEITDTLLPADRHILSYPWKAG